jgi:ribosomal protein S18 acetylase RimI-like enzyme
MTVRRATDDDADALSLLNAEIQALHASAQPSRFKAPGPETCPPETMMALLRLPENHFFVAEADSIAVGYVYAEIVRRPETAINHAYELVYVHHLYVQPAYQRRRIGNALLDAVRSVGADLGITRLALDVWTFNEGARAFFRNYGLQPYNERLWDG